MPSPPESPDRRERPGATDHSPNKTRPPTLPWRGPPHSALPQNVSLPPLIAGSLSGAFSELFAADFVDDDLLSHYSLNPPKFPLHLDRVLDSLLVDYSRQLREELYRAHYRTGRRPPKRVKVLFEGPIRQIISILNCPDVSKGILDRLAPGLSQRMLSWPQSSPCMDLPLALQQLCRYWYREMPSRLFQSSPEETACNLHTQIITSNSNRSLLAAIRNFLLTPHYVQVHINESALWHLMQERPDPPSPGGSQMVRFQFDNHLFGPTDGIADPQLVDIGSLPAITGTADECVYTTVSEYIDKLWPVYGPILLKCLGEALGKASAACQEGDVASGVSTWDASDDDDDDDDDNDNDNDNDNTTYRSQCPDLGWLRLDLDYEAIRLTVSSQPQTIVEIFEQMCWLCATLSASPFPGTLSECITSIVDWGYADDCVHIKCEVDHQPVSEDCGSSRLREVQGAAIARGFPIQGIVSTQW